jgi:chromosome segregation ATPase
MDRLEIRVVNKEKEKLNKEIIKLRNDIKKITEIKETTKNKETMGERITNLTNQISSLEKQLDENENKINELTKENEELKKNKETKKEIKDEIKLENNEENFNFLKEENALLRDQVKQLVEENEELNEKINELTQENEQLNNKLDNYEYGEEENEEAENNDEGEPFDLLLSNEILTIILLSHFQVPSEEIAQSIKNDNIDKIEKGIFMKKNDFINLKFWFEDDSNYYKDINTIFDNEKIDGYDKGKKIKEILFDLNKLDDEQINIDVFIDIITLKGITKNKNPKSIESISNYIDMFFP